MSGIAPKQNAFKFKIAPNKQKSIVKMFFGRKMSPKCVRWIHAYVVQFYN
jgi:hypothetical protein